MGDLEAFIDRWKCSGGSEHANYQLFVIELTELLGLVLRGPRRNAGGFERQLGQERSQRRAGDLAYDGDRE